MSSILSYFDNFRVLPRSTCCIPLTVPGSSGSRSHQASPSPAAGPRFFLVGFRRLPAGPDVSWWGSELQTAPSGPRCLLVGFRTLDGSQRGKKSLVGPRRFPLWPSSLPPGGVQMAPSPPLFSPTVDPIFTVFNYLILRIFRISSSFIGHLLYR